MFGFLRNVFGLGKKGNSELKTKLTHREIADRSDANARKYSVDPPRPGRKTYSERYTETNRMTSDDIRDMITEREERGQETGVLHRVLADRGE